MRLWGRVAGKAGLTPGRRFQTLSAPLFSAVFRLQFGVFSMMSSPIRLSLTVVPAPFRGLAGWRCVAVLCLSLLARTGRSQEPLPVPNDAAALGQPPSQPPTDFRGAAMDEPLSARPSGSETALPTVGEPPPMYIADPLSADGFAGIPVGAAADMLPNWPLCPAHSLSRCPGARGFNVTVKG